MILNPELFNKSEQQEYETHIRRLNYDDRDCIMYENMLHFLWPYVIHKKDYPDMDALYEEYTFWNKGIIEKVLYHSHSVPEANIQRCYQSILELIRHRPDEAFAQIAMIGKDSFSYDGMAPKTCMDARGHVLRPMSKLFILYNLAKYYIKHDRMTELEHLKKEYAYAFTKFEDEEHKLHDRYLEEQMDLLHDKIVYPVEEKVYKIPWKPKDFYLYYDSDSFIAL